MIPVFEPLITKEDEQSVLNCMQGGWVSSGGPVLSSFEQSFSRFVGCSFGTTVSNGTAALEVAFYGLGLQPGDEVIMPSFNIISSALAAVRLGLKPVFVDVDPLIWCIDPSKIEEVITEKTKAIVVVHMFGHSAEMDSIIDICRAHSIKVIEDCAQVHGAKYKGKPCGSLGDVATFSFYANKIITTGEGGMVTTNSKEIYNRCLDFKNLCFGKENKFLHHDLGYNFRMTAMQAALGTSQLERIEDTLSKKIELGRSYKEKLSQHPSIQLQIDREHSKTVYWMYCVLLKDRKANDVCKKLEEEGIQTRPFFAGMHEQEPLKKRGLITNSNYPVTELLSKNGFYLPSSLNLTEVQISHISSVLLGILK